MGRSIVYCDKCGQLLKEEDFRQGKASVADNRNYCSSCRPPSAESVLPPSVKKGSSTRIPKQPAKESVSSSKIPKQTPIDSRRLPQVATAPPPPEAGGSPSRVVAVGIAGAILGVVALLAIFSGGKKDARKPDEPTPATPVVVAVPAAKVENLNPEERRREEAARTACVKAYEVQTTRPGDLAAQWRAFETAVAAAQGTSYLGDATTQLGKLRRRFDEARGAVEARSQEVLAKEQFKPALEIWQGELAKFDVPEWTRPMNDRIGELKADFERRLGVMRDAAVEAKKRGDQAEAIRIRARVAGWGMTGYAEQIDQALAGVTPGKPDPAPNVGLAKALDAYRERWRALVAPSAARELPELVKAMEKLAAETKDDASKEAADDLENLRLAASLFQDSAPLLAKLSKGQRVSIAYWEPAGSLTRVDDTVLKIDAQRVEMKMGDASVVIPFGEVAALTLGELFKGRSARRDSDGRAAVVACLLDGDPEGAQKIRGEAFPQINEKYVEAAKELLARRTSDEKEAAARRLFYEAERGYFDFGESAAAIAKYKALLAEHAGTMFVKRNRAAIAARTEGGSRDVFFSSAELSVTPGFRLGKYGRVEAAWVSQQDVDPAKMKDNYVQLEFSAAADAEVRVWILAGGCCQEVFTFHVQGTELLAPDPEKPKEKVPAELGSGTALMVKSTNSSLKKLHSQHNGPKNPERFDWVQVAAFKYPTAGMKVLRILTSQKGFAVASAAVLTTRPGPPREIEIKEFEKWRAETPGASLKQGGVVTGCILREVFKGIEGVEVTRLTDSAAFKEDRPDERVRISSFESPVDIGDNYGTRIRGYVHPPLGGPYEFWIASDDCGELWLSTDEDPAHKRLIARCPSYASPREFGKFPEQHSEPIELKMGKRYYIEALHKEGGGGDHVEVKWKGPAGLDETPIPGNRLSPFVPMKK